MAYEPINLGDILQQVGAIKGLQQRQQYGALQLKQAQDQEAQSSALDQVLKNNPNAASADLIKAGGASAIPIAAQQQQLVAKADEQTYRQMYASASEAMVAKDPIAFIKAKHPEFIQQYDAQSGAPGTFDKLTPDQVRQMAAGIRDHAQQLLVDPKTVFQVQHEDQRAANTQAGEVARQRTNIAAENARAAASRAVTMRGQDLEQGRANKPQLVTVKNPDGTETQKWVTPGQTEGPALGPPSQKPMGEADKKNAVLFDSMMNAEKQIQSMTAGGKGTDTSSKWNAFLGGVPGNVAKVAQTDEFRKYESAGLRWAANLLYLKSGATANPDEIRSTWKQFFPQPGDGPDVKAQKEAARAQEIESTRKYMVPNAAPLPATAGAPMKIASDADYAKVPSGAQYIAPDGSTRTKR